MTNVVYNIDKCSELRIWDITDDLPTPILIESFDFTTIGLTIRPAKYGIGGVKQSQEYWNDSADLVVKKSFTYYDTGVTIRFEWFKKDGEVGIYKDEFKPLNPVEVAKLQRANRDRTISYLQATAIGTPIEPYVTAILKHYEKEINLWLFNATDDWANAIINEPEFLVDGSPNPIYNYLEIQTRPVSEEYPTGLNVRQGVLQQITA